MPKKWINILVTFSLLLMGCGGDETVQVDCNTSGLSLQVIGVDYTDCGITNGKIRVSASGGEAPYTFRINSGESNGTGLFENLATDYYTITVTDKNKCSVEKETFVGSKDGVRAVAFTTAAGCDQTNGSIVVEVRNGVPPYKYQLGENSDYQDSNEFYNLPAGNYSVWVRDVNDCGIGIYIDVLSGISFENDLKNIFASSCSNSGCHDGTAEPDLRTLDDIQNHSEAVISSILDRSMPPEIMLSADDILRIECWINDGTPDN